MVPPGLRETCFFLLSKEENLRQRHFTNNIYQGIINVASICCRAGVELGAPTSAPGLQRQLWQGCLATRLVAEQKGSK